MSVNPLAENFDSAALPPPFAWNAATLPRSPAEARRRAETLLTACRALADLPGGLDPAIGWRGELTAVARANPDWPEMPLAYAGAIGEIIEIFMRNDYPEAAVSLCRETWELAVSYNGNPAIALWLAETILQLLRCLAGMEALDALRLYPALAELCTGFPGHPGFVKVKIEALSFIINLQSQGLGEDGDPAPSKGQLRCLDAAAANYREMAALADTYRGRFCPQKLLAESVLKICAAFSDAGQPEEAGSWLAETRRLYEGNPADEDLAFSYLYSLGMAIHSLRGGDAGQAGEYCREADRVCEAWPDHSERLLKERTADWINLLAIQVQAGDLPAARISCARVEEFARRLRDADKTLALMAKGVLLAGCLQAGEIAEAEQLLTAIKDAFERLGSPESAWAVFTKAAWQLFQEYIARERLAAAAALAGDIGGMIWRSHPDEPFFAAFQEEMADELRRAGMVYRELEIGEATTRLLGKFLAPVAMLETLPKRLEDCNADKMLASAEVMSWHMRAYLACGAIQRAERIHDFILRTAQPYPDRQALWLASLQAASALIEKYCTAQNLPRAEALGREAIAICNRFPDCAEFMLWRLAILRMLHRAQLQHDGLAKAEESLAELRRLAAGSPDDYAVRVWLADPLCRQLAHHVAVGHIQPVWPLLDELVREYEAFPYAAMWEPLDQATAALGEFFLIHDRVDCLGNMVDSIAGLRQRLPNDRNIGILWIRAAHSLEVAKANMIEQTDAPSGEPPDQPSDGLDIAAAMFN